MAYQEEETVLPGSGLVGSPLAPQLGSDPRDIAKGKFDMRRLTVIDKAQLPSIMYLTIRSKKSPASKTVLDVIANWGPSVGGRGRRDIIRMEAVSKGGPASVESEIIRPGLIARNVYNRDWERKAKEEAEA